MKTILALLVSALQLGTTSSSPISNATELCGALGVMKLDMATLPEGVDPGAIRACAEHPLALSSSPIQKRRCWRGQKGGCSHGYCYRRCGEGGEWCWTARNRGAGAWISCKSDDECRGEEACAAGTCASYFDTPRYPAPSTQVSRHAFERARMVLTRRQRYCFPYAFPFYETAKPWY
ncbi:hypothetical protein Purlil1_1759 [Purpureocillium lilacinum]|uniref:IDI-2 n=1 Tax=Purpureocillium lilacinum TaxID=33203 RepID=A0ABR0CED7_PURLI|nr:hypothetical protein Purlil1_1759 [Purpureocillium lilacinum]